MPALRFEIVDAVSGNQNYVTAGGAAFEPTRNGAVSRYPVNLGNRWQRGELKHRIQQLLREGLGVFASEQAQEQAVEQRWYANGTFGRIVLRCHGVLLNSLG